ncbi:MAG: ribokinase [Dehalococcoidia bacterium]|nr:ribokinase [Dehalococcoidia bacterium]
MAASQPAPDRPRIAVLGSCTADLVFTMPRFPVAGETLFAESVELHAGGKGLNQAIAARRLGAEALLIGRIGDDAFGRLLFDALTADDVDITKLHIAADAGSGVAVPVVLPGGENSILSAPRANLAMSLEQVESARDAIATADALLLQFEAPMDVNIAAAKVANEHGVPVILNAAPIVPHPPEILSLATVLIVNEVEAEMLTLDLGPQASPEQRAARLARIARQVAIVTLGAEGALIAEAETVSHVPAFPAEAVDTVGAGDAFCAAFAVAASQGAAVVDAARFASAAGAISVGRRGAAPSLPVLAEVEQMLGKPVITSRSHEGGTQDRRV